MHRSGERKKNHLRATSQAKVLMQGDLCPQISGGRGLQEIKLYRWVLNARSVPYKFDNLESFAGGRQVSMKNMGIDPPTSQIPCKAQRTETELEFDVGEDDDGIWCRAHTVTRQSEKRRIIVWI